MIDLARAIGLETHARGEMIATAESCTGGMIAALLTETAGSSAWFERGFVTYSNASKHELLGVPMSLIDAHGAVSEPVARAMALGALKRSAATVSLAVTGIAGPGGGSPDKPVGLVHFAWAHRNGANLHDRQVFQGDRQAVRAQAAEHALSGLRRLSVAAQNVPKQGANP